MASFPAWLQARLDERGIVGVADAARSIGVSQSMVSRWLNGNFLPSRASAHKVAGWAGVPPADVLALLPPPTPSLAVPIDELRQIRDLLARANRAAAVNGVRVAHASPSQASASPPRPGDLEPVILADDRYAHLNLRPGMVVWFDDRLSPVNPVAGDIVRVGTAEPPDLRPYEPGVTTGVTAVVRLTQGHPT